MENATQFHQWCERHRVQNFGIEIGEGQYGRGVLATQDISRGSLLLRVPAKLLLSGHSAGADPDLAATLASQPQRLGSVQVLVCHLLHEAGKGAASLWAPYIALLPRTYDLLESWSHQEAAQLQVPSAGERASECAAAAHAAWRLARPVLLKLGLAKKWCSRAAWLWGSATICSRTMYVPFDAAGALMPFGDMHNYVPPPPSQPPVIPGCVQEKAPAGGEVQADLGSDGHYDESSHEYVLIANSSYMAGSEVYLCYGQHTNLELLECIMYSIEHYGFTLEGNPHDAALLPAGVVARCASGLLTHASQASLQVLGSGHPSWELLRALRLACATPGERRQHGHRAAAGQAITSGSDLSAFGLLSVLCTEVLAALPTSLEEDELLLASLDDDCAPRLRLAVAWRAGYKRALQRGVGRSSAALSVLRAEL